MRLVFLLLAASIHAGLPAAAQTAAAGVAPCSDPATAGPDCEPVEDATNFVPLLGALAPAFGLGAGAALVGALAGGSSGSSTSDTSGR